MIMPVPTALAAWGLHALGPAHTVDGGAIVHTRAARLPWQLGSRCRARVVPSLFAYLRPGCRSVAVASLNSLLRAFSLAHLSSFHPLV